MTLYDLGENLFTFT